MATKDKQLLTQYAVTWTFQHNLFGSTPKDPEMIQGWLNARMPKAKPAEARDITAINEEVLKSMAGYESDEELEQRTWLGFQRHEGHLAFRGGTVRSHLKDCARIVGKMYVGKVKGESSLGWKFTNGVYQSEYWVKVLRLDGSPISEPDGNREIAVHAIGPRGMPINALKRVDFVSQVQMSFTLNVMHGIHENDLHTVMQYGGIHGYAGERSMGEGRYTYEFHRIENERRQAKSA